MADVAAYKLKENVTLSEFEENENIESYLVRYGKKVWQASLPVYLIGKIIVEEAKTEEQIYEELLKSDRVESADEIEDDLIKQVLEFFSTNYMLEGTGEAPKSRNFKAMWVRLTVVPAKVVNKCLKFLHVLYYKLPFRILMTFGALTFLYLMFMNPAQAVTTEALELTPQAIIGVYALTLAQTLYHEFGHVSALMHYGKEAGEIGVGLYYIMPVAYSNVENSWELRRKERLYVDIGGIYFQLMIGSVLYWLNYFWWKNPLVTLSCVASAGSVITNFSPVLKLDGFWIASDAFGFTDPKAAFKEVRSGKRQMTPVKKTLFYIYYIFSTLLMAYFMIIFAQAIISSVQIFAFDIQYMTANAAEIEFSAQFWIAYLTERFTYLIALGFGINMVRRLITSAVGTIANLINKKKAKVAEGEEAETDA